MKKIISFMHISLDGFVAGLNGEMDFWQADKFNRRKTHTRSSSSVWLTPVACRLSPEAC
jgi:hypothetical protein